MEVKGCGGREVGGVWSLVDLSRGPQRDVSRIGPPDVVLSLGPVSEVVSLLGPDVARSLAP